MQFSWGEDSQSDTSAPPRTQAADVGGCVPALGQLSYLATSGGGVSWDSSGLDAEFEAHSDVWCQGIKKSSQEVIRRKESWGLFEAEWHCKGNHALIPGACQWVTLQSKRDLADVTKVGGLSLRLFATW